MSAKTIRDISEQLSQVGKELYVRGLVKGNSGNISARIPDGNKFLIKPSGACLGKLKPEEFVVVDSEGNKIRGRREVSAETPMHAAIYKARRDVQAVVHSHAPTATAFGIAREEILPLQIELFMLLPRGAPVVPFKQPGSKELAEEVQKRIADHDAVILESHGIVTVGSTLEAACSLNEMDEEAAKIQLTVILISGENTRRWADLTKKFKAEKARKMINDGS